MEPRKILIIGHNCFSDSGSNGRTLANFFKGYPSDKLAQFYIYNEQPQSDVCDTYYRITDKEALKSLFSRKYGGEISRKNANDPAIQIDAMQRKPKKTPFVYWVREHVWRFGHWRNKRLRAWIDAFSPEVVLLQAGDSAFLFDFARRVSQQRGIPLVIYNTESYYFKDQSFLAASRFSNLWYKILHRYFRKRVGRAIRHAKQTIYNSDMLRELYETEFQVPSATVLSSTDLLGTPAVKKTEQMTISYLGNFGVGRCEGLIELAGILRSIAPSLTLNVYGNASPQIEQQFAATEGICYRGFVSYADCVRIMKESTLLVHVESFEAFYLEDSRYAFSTKIADCLASGTCLFVYAPRELTFTDYLNGHGAAAVASSLDEARELLSKLLDSEGLRQAYARRAMEVAFENHEMERNRQKFLEALYSNIT